jgi:signal recognition particle subunit SRP54
MFDKLTGKVQDALKFVAGKSTITEKNINDAVDAIKMALLEADVNIRVVRRFVNSTIEEARGEKVLRAVDPGQQFVKIVHDKLVGFLGGSDPKAGELALKGPDTQSVVLMMGLQGSGKTTTSAKLALSLKKQGRKPILAACDLVRPAAAEQLSVLAGQAGVPLWRDGSSVNGDAPQPAFTAGGKTSGDPVKVFHDALSFAKRNMNDVLIVDTAGRMQLDDVLMAELKKLTDAASPVEKLLVADAMTGQAACDIAKAFNEQIGVTGVVLTKFDSDTRGGAALSLKTITGQPVKYVGTGEKLEDLEKFHPERAAGRILGMGDVVSLVEKAQSVIDQKEALEIQRKMEKEDFSLDDYLNQLRSLKKMGNMQSVMNMIPGMQGKISEEDIEKSEMGKHEVIMQSMTRKERANYLIIGPSRRARIAKGSGTSVAEVARLLKKFEKMRTMMKKMAKFSKAAGKNPGMAQALMQQMGRR